MTGEHHREAAPFLIRQGGFEADVRAFAYRITTEPDETQPNPDSQMTQRIEAELYYLDIVGEAAESVRAVTHGLINAPPKETVLYHNPRFKVREGEHDLRTAFPKAVWLTVARTGNDGGWSLREAALARASAYQAVMLPLTAYDELLTGGRGDERLRTQAARSTERFVIVKSDEAVELATYSIARLYRDRLNKLTTLPTRPAWSEWLWNYANSAGLIIHLTSYRCHSAVCQLPKAEELAEAVSAGIRSGELSFELTKGEISRQYPVSRPEDEAEPNADEGSTKAEILADETYKEAA